MLVKQLKAEICTWVTSWMKKPARRRQLNAHKVDGELDLKTLILIELIILLFQLRESIKKTP